jgi:uncharacterized protein
MKKLFAYIIRMRKHAFSGFVAGLLNGFLGAGGGMVIVPMLEKNGLEPSSAHATSIAVIVPLCVLSAILYMGARSLTFYDALPYLPAGLIGAYLGAKLLPHIPGGLLRRIFGAFMLYAAFRLLWR